MAARIPDSGHGARKHELIALLLILLTGIREPIQFDNRIHFPENGHHQLSTIVLRAAMPLDHFLNKLKGMEGRFCPMPIVEQLPNLYGHAGVDVAKLERMKRPREKARTVCDCGAFWCVRMPHNFLE